MVGVEDEQQVQGLLGDEGRFVVLARGGEHHVQEVGAVPQVIARVHDGLADGVLVSRRRDGRDLGDQPVRRDLPVVGVIDVEGVVVEGGLGADHPHQHGHGVGVIVESVQELAQVLVEHGVVHDDALEPAQRRPLGQFTVEQQVGDLQEARLGGQLLDGIAAVQQHALFAVDIGDGAVAARRRHEPGVVGEDATLPVEARRCPPRPGPGCPAGGESPDSPQWRCW